MLALTLAALSAEPSLAKLGFKPDAPLGSLKLPSNPEEMQLATLDFGAAQNFIEYTYAAGLKPQPSNKQYLEFYQYFKQATVGDCNETANDELSLKQNMMLAAWKRGAGIKRPEAMVRYLRLAFMISQDWPSRMQYTPVSHFGLATVDGPFAQGP